MPAYRVHRIKDAPREAFRWESHGGGQSIVKLKDYEPDRLVEASSPYAAWKVLASEGRGLRTGDLLEILGVGEESASGLLIAKYTGFEPAQWFVFERKASPVAPAYEAGNSDGSAQESSVPSNLTS